MLVVAWADGAVGTDEAETVRDRAGQLSPELRAWVEDRLEFPPGPYFRYQVAHLMSFMVCVWHREERGKAKNWAEAGQEWADDLIQEAGWLRRVLGGLNAEIRDLEALRRVLDEKHIPTSDRLWALARGAHAEAEPHRAVAVAADIVPQQRRAVDEVGDERRLAAARLHRPRRCYERPVKPSLQ